MPPVTRRSQAQQGVAKKAPSRKPRATRQTSRDASASLDIQDDGIDRQQTNSIAQDETDSNADSVTHALAPAARPSSFAHRQLTATTEEAVNPLREMAEKIGKQVETFAEHLDQFFDTLRSLQESEDGRDPAQTRFYAVLDLVDEFHDISAQAVLELKKNHERERAAQLREEWSQAATIEAAASKQSTALVKADKPVLSEKKADQVRQLRNWQQETDLWDLFRLVLETHYRPDQDQFWQERQAQLDSLDPVHRYTPESEIYRRFLLEDDLAFERSAIKLWLEQTADHQESDVQGIVEELEKKAGRGKGLWSHGWMHTREKIKGEKRLRTWPDAEDSPLPQLRRTDNTEMLVTTLDPDAATRQDRTLEKPDSYLEQAIWTTCWEMLRRGKPASEVSKWCAERKEGWRAVSIGRGSSHTDVASARAWRKSCYLASQAPSASDYEAAVYGLLGGNVKAVQKVCRTVDDHLFAYYSAALTQGFDQYLARIDSTQSSAVAHISDLQDPEKELVSLVLKLRSQSTTSNESVQPLKIIQSYLLAHDVRSMIHTVGHAIAYTDAQREQGEQMILHLPQFWEGNSNVPEAEVGLDSQALRIATHMSIILRTLHSDHLAEDTDAEENVIVAWIQALRAAGKRDLIPIYASRLQKARYIAALSRVLPDVTQPSEQEEVARLLQQYNLDLVSVLNAQVDYLLQSVIQPLSEPDRPLQLLEATTDTKLYPGQRIILNGLPDELTQDDEVIVRSLKWYNVLRGHWKDTFDALSLALRSCLVHGRIACALEIVHTFPYENVSLQKSYQVIGRSVNLMEFDADPPEEEAATWRLLARQSRTYHELEAIVTAIKALAHWRECEETITSAGPRSSSSSSVSSEIRNAKDAIDEAMALILTPGLLVRPDDSTILSSSTSSPNYSDAHDRHLIRTSYIPELILAYNSALHSAGSILSREALIQSMDLSVTIARDESQLAECFVRAGRMRELVTSFAQTSKLMLLLKELGGKRRVMGKGEGKDLGLWEIGPQGGAAMAAIGAGAVR